MSTLAQVRAEKARQQFVDAATRRWEKAVKEMGLNTTAKRSGLREIEASRTPGRAVNRLIREYRGRQEQAVETSPLADPSDVQEMVIRLYRARGCGWFNSDPQYDLILRIDREVAAGQLTKAEFEEQARIIEAMPLPYARQLLEDEKRGASSHNERNPVQTKHSLPDHMKKVSR